MFICCSVFHFLYLPLNLHGVCQVTARHREEEVTVVYCAHCVQWCSSSLLLPVQWQAAECSAWRDTVKVTAADGKTLQRGTLFYFTCPYLCATSARTAHDNVLKLETRIYLLLKHILGSCEGIHTFSTMHQGKFFLPFPALHTPPSHSFVLSMFFFVSPVFDTFKLPSVQLI